ncbi:MAG: hypothetical protein H0U74_10995 [Bradymonadaceae bacterium]|nr:hypothetical protein [Lujinxingiaceae bacterium]
MYKGALEDGEEGGPKTLKCTVPSDTQGGDGFFSRGQINLREIKESGGQDASGPGLLVSGAAGSRNQFKFIAGFTNRLPDSGSVGSSSDSNMQLDANYIYTTGATVSFPSELNVFNLPNNTTETFEFTQDRSFTILLLSDGGGAITGIPILQGAADVAYFEAFLKDKLGSPAEPVTFVAEIQIKGKSGAGTEVESNIFRYPIDICLSCAMGSTPTCLESGG